MEQTYTLAQIRAYIESQDSLGDVMYNLERIDRILADLAEKQENEEEE